MLTITTALIEGLAITLELFEQDGDFRYYTADIPTTLVLGTENTEEDLEGLYFEFSFIDDRQAQHFGRWGVYARGSNDYGITVEEIEADGHTATQALEAALREIREAWA